MTRYIVNSVIILIPTLFALFVHNYICHSKLSIIRKAAFFVIYVIIIGALMYAAAWVRGIKGIGITYMTTSHKIEFTILGCVMAFFIAMAVCLIAEEDVTFEKLRLYLRRFTVDVRKYFRYAIRSARSGLRSEVDRAVLYDVDLYFNFWCSI